MQHVRLGVVSVARVACGRYCDYLIGARLHNRMLMDKGDRRRAERAAAKQKAKQQAKRAGKKGRRGKKKGRKDTEAGGAAAIAKLLRKKEPLDDARKHMLEVRGSASPTSPTFRFRSSCTSVGAALSSVRPKRFTDR